MRAPRFALLAALTLALAGCITSTDLPQGTAPVPLPERGPFVDPIPEDDGHDHADAAQHNFSTPTMEQIGFNILSGEETAYSYIGEMDWRGDLLVVQVLGRGSMPGFVLVNVSDPRNPQVVGRADLPYSYVVDVKFSPDGTRVFAASQAGTSRAPLIPGGLDLSYLNRNGVAVFDIRDPAQPLLEGVMPVEPSGCHMLSVAEVAGGLHVFCVADTIAIFVVEEDPQGKWTLLPVGQYSPQSTAGTDETIESRETAPGPLPHDMTFQFDPVDGTPLLYVSYWDLGLRVVDVSNPRAPREVGTWAGQGAARYEGNVHGAAPTVVDGKRYVVVGPELLSDNPPALYVLDATDYRNMQLVGEWIPPGEHGAEGLLLTTHQFQLIDGRLYLAYNHAGVWVLDLRAIINGTHVDNPERPEVLGYYLPHEPVKVFDPKLAKVPNTWDVVVRNGAIYGSDRYTGLYVLHYLPDELGNPALSSVT
ncbi:MAG TPA: hypothetical protein VNZ52_06000 [Candidatus Thermoplasmatota archaeon]|nr:hypothetical protein [Candidatus Thermoplasmatota archaeon]